MLRALALPLCGLAQGRASYLCHQRLQQQARYNPVLAPAQARIGAHRLWAQGTQSGDLAQVARLDERSPLLGLITSTRDNCLGQDCPRFADCHVYQARRTALAADVLVINHHLFFADQAVRESGVAQLLPNSGVVVLTRPINWPETASQFLGAQLGTAQLHDLAQDLLAAATRHARDLPTNRGSAPCCARRRASCTSLWPIVLRVSCRATVAWVDGARWLDATAWMAQWRVHGRPARASRRLDGADGAWRLTLAHLHEERTVDLLARLARFSAPGSADGGALARLGQPAAAERGAAGSGPGPASPAWQGPPAEAGAWDEPGCAIGAKRTWVFTSATLGDDAQTELVHRGLRHGWRTHGCVWTARSTMRAGRAHVACRPVARRH